MPRSSLRRQARLSGGCCNRSSLPDVAAVLPWPLNQGLWRTIRRGYAAARTCNGRTRPNRGWSYTAEALLRPAPCSDEHRTWRVYHGQSRFGLRWVPHADSGKPRAAGFELAGFDDRVRRLPGRRRTLRFCPGVTCELDKVGDGNVREPEPVSWGSVPKKAWPRSFTATRLKGSSQRAALIPRPASAADRARRSHGSRRPGDRCSPAPGAGPRRCARRAAVIG
jgi:hypothetical protein